MDRRTPANPDFERDAEFERDNAPSVRPKGGGTLGTLVKSLVLLGLFVSITLPVVLSLSGGFPHSGSETSDGLDCASGGRETCAFSRVQPEIENAVEEFLSSYDRGNAGTVSRIFADQDRQYPVIYREIPIPVTIAFESVRKRLSGFLEEMEDCLVIVPDEFDSKNYQILVAVESKPSHVLLFTKAPVEDQSGDQKVEKEKTEYPPDLLPEKPTIAIVIDDIGYRRQIEHKFLELDFPITFSVIPGTPWGKEFAESALREGREIMLHMPMEPLGYPDVKPGRGALLTSMNESEILRLLEQALEQIPGVSGMNNHMGSRFTADRDRMAVVCRWLAGADLFLVDSRTTAKSRALAAAREQGVPALQRDVFLDNEPELQGVLRQMAELISTAQRKGVAVGIGHPHEPTLQALRLVLPGLKARGIRMDYVGELVY